MSDYIVTIKGLGMVNYTGGRYEVLLANNVMIKTSNTEKLMIVLNGMNA